jgi:hypothetical protein
MITLLLAQLVVPALLVAWLVVRPPRSALGLAAQIAGSLLILTASIRAALWLFPPWWTPYAAIVLIGATVVGHASRSTWTSTRPRGALGWTGVALFASLGALGGFVLLEVRAARRIPDSAHAVELAFPLAAGSYVVMNGGSVELLNAHRASARDDAPERMRREYRGNGYAVDVVAVDGLGLRASGLLPADPARYRIFGTEVLAPCSGVVLTAEDGHADLRIPETDRDHLAGNHVLLECGGVHVLLGHLKEGSVRVRAGDVVAAGDFLARVGNSGGSNEPHLHIHAQRPGPAGRALAGDPLPMLLDGRYAIRGDRIEIQTTGAADAARSEVEHVR